MIFSVARQERPGMEKREKLAESLIYICGIKIWMQMHCLFEKIDFSEEPAEGRAGIGWQGGSDARRRGPQARGAERRWGA